MGSEPLSLALGALARKERSVAELGQWLRGRGIGEEEVEGVIDHLVSVGALDDARFAAAFARDKREISGWGRDRVATALAARGVGEEQIAAALEDEDPEQEIERAVEVVCRRVGAPADDRDRRRALGLLVRRGYDSDIAYEAVRRAGRRAA